MSNCNYFSHYWSIWQTFLLGYPCQIFTCSLWWRSHYSFTQSLTIRRSEFYCQSACQVSTSRGNATASLDLLSEWTLAIALTCVTFTDGPFEANKWRIFVQLHRSHNVASVHKWHVSRIHRTWERGLICY